MQPPNHAIAALHIYEHAPDRQAANAFLQEIYPGLVAWHRFLRRERDFDGDGLVYIRHNWESGQDNSPIWDGTLQRMQPAVDEIPPYQRADLDVVAAGDRPLDFAYDRYVWLVATARERDYDEAAIREHCPFLIEDVLFNTLLVQADADLGRIAGILGDDPEPFQVASRQTATAMNRKLWSPGDGMYLDYDLRAGDLIPARVGAGFSPLYAGIPDRSRADAMLARLDSDAFCRLNEACWAVPSYDRDEPGFDPHRYWRGPVWLNLNWVIYHGLRRYGFDEHAAKVHATMLELPRRSGFFEYFDPESGAGHGASDFSWTAALVIDLLAEQGAAPAAGGRAMTSIVEIADD